MLKFFKKHHFACLTVIILLFSAALRLYKMGDVPHGMTWDEAAIGYNGYAIFTTRRDEWIHKLPISFRSFGDYKAPFAIYLNGLFTYLFGLNLWAVRFPFVLIGISAILGIILLTREVGKTLNWKSIQLKWLPIVSGTLLTLSPWHLHFSRTGFESGIALSFTIWAMFLLFKFYNSKTGKLVWLFSSVLMFSLTFYTYHSSKIVSPVLILMVIVYLFDKTKQLWRSLLAGGISGIVLLLPLIKDSIFGKGLERASTLIFNQSDSIPETISLFSKQFIAHLNPSFLVMGESTNFRNGDGNWGVLLPVTFFLVVISFFFIYKRVIKRQNWGFYLFALSWIAVGIAPAALGLELVPHSNRSLLALPGFIILAIFSLLDFSKWLESTKINKKIIGSHGEKNMVWISVMGTMIFFQAIFFVKYLNNYYTNFAASSSSDFVDGYLEAFDYVKQFEAEKGKIVFTSEYGQPYIFALFSRKTNPIWYQGGSLIKYEFKEVNVGDLERTNAIIVAGQDSEFINPERADKVIYGSDGEVRFKIFIK